MVEVVPDGDEVSVEDIVLGIGEMIAGHAAFDLDVGNDRLDGSGEHIHHSDCGVQHVSINYTERLAEAGIEPPVGSVGDSYDNALAETINGLYKTEVIHGRGPRRPFEPAEFTTLE